ncbi:CD9 antigen isoform X1 [Lepisosteus oculatus]|uniref:CD9 antigen isoform X1 n=1 Tax=Lepisosteus oculatus TaxID=7918 RepID=UPI0035F527BE
MALDGCGYCCKVILIIFNIFFAIVGFAMLGLGLWLRFGSETRGFFDIDLNTQQFVIGVTVLMVTGTLMLLVALFGDCGACSESRCALGVFSGLLTVLILAEITAGVLAFVNSDEVGKQLAEFYATIYAQYVNKGGDPSLAVTLKIFHNALDCCGIGGGILEPFVRETCPRAGLLQTLVMPSCPAVIVDVFNSRAPVVLGCFVGLALLMVLALLCSSVLSRQIKRTHQGPQYLILENSSVTLQPAPLSPPPGPAALLY